LTAIYDSVADSTHLVVVTHKGKYFLWTQRPRLTWEVVYPGRLPPGRPPATVTLEFRTQAPQVARDSRLLLAAAGQRLEVTSAGAFSDPGVQTWSHFMRFPVPYPALVEALATLSNFFDPGWERTWSLRKALRKIGVEAELKDDLDEAHRRITEVLDKHRELLKGIRDNVIGHREQDVQMQLTWMKRAEITELQNLGWELLKLNSWIIGVMTRVAGILNRRPPPGLAPRG
jgi:hypothetical protein